MLVSTQWIEATFLVPGICNFSEHLDALNEFEIVSDALFIGSGHAEPFFDVHRAAIRLVIPPDDECEAPIPDMVGIDVEHEVFLLLEGGHLKGRLSVKKGQRVSDFFRTRRGFVALRDCSIVPHDLSSEEGASEPCPLVAVSSECVPGVSEPHPPGR